MYSNNIGRARRVRDELTAARKRQNQKSSDGCGFAAAVVEIKFSPDDDAPPKTIVHCSDLASTLYYCI